MKRFALLLIGLFCVWTVFATLDGSQANKIISSGSATGAQSIPSDVRTQLNTAISTSDAAIQAVQRIDGAERNRLIDVFPTGGAQASSLLTDLISYWKLDEASGTRVDSVTASGNDLTDNNTVTFAADGKQGNAANFVNANDENLTKASNASLQAGDIDFTWAGWFRLTDKAIQYYMLYKGAAVTTEYGLQYYKTGDRFRAVHSNSLNNIVTADNLGSPSEDTWYFIVMWHDQGASTWNIQVNNGTADSLSDPEPPVTGTEALYIGDIGVATSNSLNGDIDELGYWKRVLTAGEKTTLYKAGAGVTYPSFAMHDFKKIMYFLVGYKPVKEKHRYKNDFYL